MVTDSGQNRDSEEISKNVDGNSLKENSLVLERGNYDEEKILRKRSTYFALIDVMKTERSFRLAIMVIFLQYYVLARVPIILKAL